MHRILIIIPAYNEADNLEYVVNSVKKGCPEADYVIVNDGSKDATRKVCRDNHYNMLDLPVNVGLAGAMRAGMKYANFYNYDYAVQIDGDGQHRPENIDQMMKCMQRTKADIVIGSRYKNKKKPFSARMTGSRLISGAVYLTTRGHYIGDVTSGMRLFNKRMIKQFAIGFNYRPEPDTLAFLLNQGIKIEEVQVEMDERTLGTSYLNFGNSIMYMLHVLFNVLVFQWVRKD